MDTKSFLIGAACGAVVVATVNWVLDASREHGLIDEPGFTEERSPLPSAESPLPSVDRPADATPPDNSTGETDADPVPAVEDPSVPVAVPPTVDFQSDSLQVSLTELPTPPLADRERSGRDPNWAESMRSVLEEEPKDDSWAYYMEQAILQFLSSHPAIAQFEISYIACRTTMCQTQVIGYDESTGPVWQQVMYDMRQQPWSEFGQTGSSSGTVDGRLVIVTTVHRQQDGE